ncbi:MAG: hypothetical protein ABI895_15325 [Deltaproteobacteria bacterium]
MRRLGRWAGRDAEQAIEWAYSHEALGQALRLSAKEKVLLTQTIGYAPGPSL